MLSVNMSGEETANEQHNVNQILKSKTNRAAKTNSQLSADISGAETANEQHNVKQIMKAKNIMLEMRATNCRRASHRGDYRNGSLLPRVEIAPLAGCSTTAVCQSLKVNEWAEAHFTPEIRFMPVPYRSK